MKRLLIWVIALMSAASVGATVATVGLLAWAGAHFRQIPMD